MDESYVIPVLTELKEMRAKTYKLSDWHAFTKLKEDDCKFILSRAIELIEYLDGKLEDLDRFQDLAISRNKELQQELERSTRLEQRCSELVIDRDKAVEYWTKHCEALLQKHREELAAKDREIYKLKKAKLSSAYGYIDTDIAHMYPKIMLNNPANFCGNCKHCEIRHGVEDYAICNNKWCMRFVIDPDDASCPHFEPTYNTRVVIGKPEFPVCEKCNHEDCSNCTLCPF